jgi:hypothetical protein
MDMDKKGDPLVFGGLAGVLVAIPQAGFGIIAKTLHLTDRTYVDFGRSVVMHNPQSGALAWIVGILAHLVIGSIFGVLFTLLIRRYSTKYIYIKGLGTGFVGWYVLAFAGTIFHVPKFVNIPPAAAAETFVGAGFYGLVLAFLISLFYRRQLV